MFCEYTHLTYLCERERNKKCNFFFLGSNVKKHWNCVYIEWCIVLFSHTLTHLRGAANHFHTTNLISRCWNFNNWVANYNKCNQNFLRLLGTDWFFFLCSLSIKLNRTVQLKMSIFMFDRLCHLNAMLKCTQRLMGSEKRL